jgi:NTE family protein
VEAIQERIAEITFSANLVREMSQFTQALAHARPGFGGSGSLDRRLLNTHIHMVDSSGLASLQGTGTKLLAHAPFMQSLMRQGQERAHQWLATDFDCVGRRTSVDLEKWFS